MTSTPVTIFGAHRDVHHILLLSCTVTDLGLAFANMASPPPEPTLEQKMHMTDSYHRFVHNTSVAMLLVAPVLIALPPRKLDFYTFALGGIFAVSGNQLLRERNGVGILGLLPGRSMEASVVAASQGRRILEEPVTSDASIKEAMREGRQTHSKMVEKVKSIPMTGDTEGWKERRLKEEQEKLDQGEGYGGMIMDQIWDVWNWGEKKAEQLEDKDEQVLRDQEKQRKEEQRAREFPVIGKS